MGILGSVHGDPVERSVFSPDRAHSEIPLLKRLRGVIPVVHTPYDYNKGIS